MRADRKTGFQLVHARSRRSPLPGKNKVSLAAQPQNAGADDLRRRDAAQYPLSAVGCGHKEIGRSAAIGPDVGQTVGRINFRTDKDLSGGPVFQIGRSMLTKLFKGRLTGKFSYSLERQLCQRSVSNRPQSKTAI